MDKIRRVFLLTVSFLWEHVGKLFEKIEKYGLAIGCYKKGLSAYRKVSLKPQPAVARLYKNMGEAWSGKDDYDKAIECFEKALDENLKIYSGWKPFDRGHFILATDWSHLGNIWYFNKNYDKAIEYMEMGLPVFIEILGELDPGVALQREFLAGAREAKGDNKIALELYNKALLGFQKYNFSSSVINVQKNIKALEKRIAE